MGLDATSEEKRESRGSPAASRNQAWSMRKRKKSRMKEGIEFRPCEEAPRGSEWEQSEGDGEISKATHGGMKKN